MDKYLNIVSFNIPYPANYGGVIDVYYKLEALRACGVKLILHCSACTGIRKHLRQGFLL